MTERDTIIDLHAVGKGFRAADGTARPVLQDVDLRLAAGEIVALLGPSGSGKSTLLRILAGLVPADRGEVRYRGQPLHGPARGIAMVFQSFALFPWLTVQQNVELGLEARGVPQAERARRAASAIELIGLGGFEGALPRELSGGMRQRVGIARALVVEPDVLLMDEAFSALDVLTGERLRDDILALWEGGQMPTQAMLVVSHNIEEAVLMADRVLVFAADPGRVRAELRIALPRPRDRDSVEVRMLIDQVYALMTAGASGTPHGPKHAVLAERLPSADVARMEGLLELLVEDDFQGRADLPRLADEAELTDHDLLPLTQGLSLLGLARLAEGDLLVTPLGRHYAGSARAGRQRIFGQQLLERVPLAAHIRHSLEQDAQGQISEEHFLDLLRESLDGPEALRVLRQAIEWGRYGEVFEYDFRTGMIHLPAPDPVETADG
ncbi:nitrate/sulfonate/bicarbonate ABC transporter ATP-binding protein [Pseudacidovorax sp. RU35E]|nr:nitrate/sulfonate/bicarbonate ABC transporter ATP-binding protein [Pseudacidovorax sp. RU35E]SIQ08556.1 NitT/TauT family transport system ATP-binding protein [Pseudacidovorax sp. RU35E]